MFESFSASFFKWISDGSEGAFKLHFESQFRKNKIKKTGRKHLHLEVMLLATPESNLECLSWVPGGGKGGGKTCASRFGESARDEKIGGFETARMDLNASISGGPEDRRINKLTYQLSSTKQKLLAVAAADPPLV